MSSLRLDGAFDLSAGAAARRGIRSARPGNAANTKLRASLRWAPLIGPVGLSLAAIGTRVAANAASPTSSRPSQRILLVSRELGVEAAQGARGVFVAWRELDDPGESFARIVRSAGAQQDVDFDSERAHVG